MKLTRLTGETNTQYIGGTSDSCGKYAWTGYDGANNMSSGLVGVQAHIKRNHLLQYMCILVDTPQSCN